jgi:hypothetical protein
MENENKHMSDYNIPVKGGETNMEGYAKAKAVASKLKAEKEESEVKEQETRKIATTQVNAVALPKSYFNDNVNVGLSDLSVDDVPIPTLSIVQSSSKFRDEDGRPFTPGFLYYKALKKAYEVVECSVLVIKKREMPSYEDKTQLERTYIFLGVLHPEKVPFLMYNKSTGYFAARQFIGEVKARKYPMYALKVEITTEKRQNAQGEWFVPVFNVVGLEADPDEIVTLEGLAKEYESNSSAIRSEEEDRHVEAKAVEEKIETAPEDGEVVDPTDIPF